MKSVICSYSSNFQGFFRTPVEKIVKGNKGRHFDGQKLSHISLIFAKVMPSEIFMKLTKTPSIKTKNDVAFLTG